jgi:tetratricopeptide (TPR) repeat protein
MDGRKSMASGIPVGSGLTPDEWARAQDVFLALLDEPPDQRAAAARALCGDSAALLDTVERLLAGHVEENGLFGPPPEDPSSLPRPLGAYLLTEEIGRGGMGTVYRAQRADGQFEKQVAVKLLAPDLLTPRAVGRFRQERQILAGLEHPYIARLLDGGVSGDGRPYIVMEHVDGIPVDRYCRDRALTTRQIVELAVKICAAVEHAHTHGIVHRDLKPGNLLIAPDGTPRLLDFGISQLLADSAQPSATAEERTRALTPHYASPEQLAGAPATPASDVYSLGVLFQELLTQHQPASRLSQDLQAIVRKAAAPAPHARYSSGQQLREDLERHLAGLPVAARPRTLMPRWAGYVKRYRWQVVMALLVISSIAVAMAARHQAKVNLARKIEAVKAIQSLFWDTHKRMSLLPGSLEARRQLIQQALTQLAVVEREVEDDPDLLYELAQCYVQLAFAQGSGGFSIGDFSDAARTYQRAIYWGTRAVQQTGSVRAVVLVPDIFSAASNNSLWNSEYREAEKLAAAGQQFLEQHRAEILRLNGPQFYPLMATFLDYRAEALQAEGQIERAKDLWRQADALADGVSGIDRLPNHLGASLKIMLALAYCETGNTELGAEYAASGESLAALAAQKNPAMSIPVLRKAQRTVGECDLLAGRSRDASEKLQMVRQAYRVALERETGHPGLRIGLADADRLLGSALLRLGDLQGSSASYREGLDLLSSPPDFARSRLAESNRAELLAGRGHLEQAQANLSPHGSPAAEQYWQAACADYRRADTIFREWTTNRGMFLSVRLAMADVEKELPKCPPL